MWLDNLKMTALSWSTKSSDSYAKRIGSGIVIALIGISAAIIEGLSFLAPSRVSYRIAPETTTEIRTQSVTSQIFGLLSNDEETRKIRTQTLFSDLPVFTKGKISQSFDQDRFSGKSGLPSRLEHIKGVEQFIEAFPEIRTAAACKEKIEELNIQKKAAYKELEETQAKIDSSKKSAIAPSPSFITLNEKKIAELKAQIKIMESIVKAFDLDFRELYPLDTLFGSEPSAIGELAIATKWLKEKTGGLTGFNLEWLEKQEDCREKSLLSQKLIEYNYNPLKRLERLRQEQEAITAFQAYKTENNLLSFNLENIRQFELENPEKNSIHANFLEKMALKECLEQAGKDSERRENITFILQYKNTSGSTQLISLKKNRELNPEDPLNDYPELYVYQQYQKMRDCVAFNTGKTDEESAAIVANTLWMSSQSMDAVELSANAALLGRISSEFDAKKGLCKFNHLSFGSFGEDSSKTPSWTFTLNPDGNVSINVEKTASGLLMPDRGPPIFIPIDLKISGSFNGKTYDQTIVSSGAKLDDLHL